jgi:hypothetical protein
MSNITSVNPLHFTCDVTARAIWRRRREPLVVPSITQVPSTEDGHEYFQVQEKTPTRKAAAAEHAAVWR